MWRCIQFWVVQDTKQHPLLIRAGCVYTNLRPFPFLPGEFGSFASQKEDTDASNRQIMIII